jgi:regulator of cell morphogenesis and NO signaling
MFKALKSTGIFSDGNDVNLTVGDLCWNFGLNPAVMLDILARARAAEAPSGIDVSELDGLTLTQVVENIETAHHAYLRESLPVLGQLVGRVAEVHGDTDVRLIKVRELVQKMSADLDNHMQHEEDALFQIARDLDSGGIVRQTPCGNQIGGPIACMENEHEQARRELAELRLLTNDFMTPSHACNTYRRMLVELERFAKDMAVHMCKEDEVLFPRAIKAQEALRARAKLQGHG